jgi:hypothetical protein
MTRTLRSKIRLAASSSLVLTVLGCSGAGEEVADETDLTGDVASEVADLDRSRFHRPWYRRAPGAGGTGGVVTPPVDPKGGTGNAGGAPPAGTADCSVCATALACCNTVSGGPRCTQSEATCESLDPVRRKAYVVSCKTFLDTTVRVWSTPPSTCQR